MTITARDVQQFFSFGVSAATLILIFYKLHIHRGAFKVWFPFFLITVLTLAYYAAVFIDSHIRDIFNASDWSATLRMAVQIALLLYAWYMPPARRK